MRPTTIYFGMLLVFLSAQLCIAQIPSIISYQGMLVESSGTPVEDGSYDLTFRFYSDGDPSTPIWSEEQSVAVVRGIFNVILENVNPLEDSFDDQYWLGIRIGNDQKLVPRLELTSVAYSMISRTVEDGAIATSKLADASVTANKIAAGTLPNASSQVLTWNGLGLTWQTPPGGGGLVLPYNGEANQGNAAFAISNNSSDAIRGFTISQPGGAGPITIGVRSRWLTGSFLSRYSNLPFTISSRVFSSIKTISSV